MFDGLLKSKFYLKCKTAIKLTKTRMEIIKRKRSAMQKYLKNDVVDLLNNGFDTNAYGRVEGLWNELNLSSCYDLVEQFCTHISSNLAGMDKQRECPEECKEAASSLMYAAARFSDLPELRELRTVFTERYGNSIESCVNKEFVHKLKSRSPTKEMKLQLMQDIALETGIEWNSKTLEQKLYKNPPASTPNWTENGNEGKGNSPKGIDKADHNVDTKNVEHKHDESIIYASSEREDGKIVGERRKLSHLSYEEAENITPIKEIQVDRINRKVQQNETHTVSTSEEENDDKKPFYYKSIRPPYMKSKVSITNTATDVPPTGSETKLETIQKSGHNSESDDLQKDDPITNTKPKPISVRRRNIKPLPGKIKEENSGGTASETMSSKGINQGGGNEILNDRQNDEWDEEERKLDRLLMHYSKRKLPHDTGESKPVFKPSPQAANDIDRGNKDRGRDGPPTRVASLPTDLSPTEAKKVHARASSFQPEMLDSNGHVHPKLPDYDDFVARLAALRGNLK